MEIGLGAAARRLEGLCSDSFQLLSFAHCRVHRLTMCTHVLTGTAFGVTVAALAAPAGGDDQRGDRQGERRGDAEECQFPTVFGHEPPVSFYPAYQDSNERRAEAPPDHPPVAG